MATVLVVDDEPDIRYLVKVNLELDGHTVRTAANGAEALEEVRREAPDVVLLDVMMPEVDGWTVLETMKGEPDPDVRTIPIVMLTAFGGDEGEVRSGIEGAIRYLTKPISPEALRNEVQAALAG